MVYLSVASLLSLLLFAQRALTLQVTPNSPCAQYCLDDQSEDPSDPNSSNTYGSDITCSDASYNTTAIGQKFKSCVSCLQNSTSKSSGENDQAWFIYNLRYALSSCLFDFSNATDADSTPCSTNESCGPLQQALEDGNLIPANETTYSYCSVDGDAVLGSSVDKCVSCLRSGGTETYLANFLLAVYTGCQQQPPAGTNIGIQGTVFSTEQINATYPGYNSNSSSSKKNHSLGSSVIVGIVLGFIVLLIIIYAIFFVACRKRREARRLKALHSPLHSRFGATNITSPNNGAYGNPYAVPAVTVAPTNDDSSLSLRELKLLKARGVLPKGYIGSPQYKEFGPASFGTDATEHRSDKHNSGQGSVMPTHPAYIPSAHTPVSPNTSISSSTYTNDAYQVSPHSSQSSPMNFQHPRTSPRQIPPPIVTNLTNKSPPPPYQSEGDSHVGPIREPPRSYSRRARDNSRDGGSRAPSRSDSRGGPWTRGGRNTNQQGVGNSMASTVESVHSMEVPVTISGPIIRHDDHRFDFDLAQRERQEREAATMLHKRPSWSPESNDSPEEQWPGNY